MKNRLAEKMIDEFYFLGEENKMYFWIILFFTTIKDDYDMNISKLEEQHSKAISENRFYEQINLLYTFLKTMIT